MALATSGSINLTDVRDFYGQSGSINMTSLYKAGSHVPDPATYATSNFTKTNDTSDALPIELFDNGGVVPSLDTEANQNIPTSGSIDLTDFYSGYKLVNPTVTKATDGSSGVDLTSSAVMSGRYTGNALRPDLAHSGYLSNYQDADSVSYRFNYGQLVTLYSSALGGGTFSSHIEVQFKVSHAGVYTLHGVHVAPGGEGTAGVTLTGSGVSIIVGNRSNNNSSQYDDGDSVSGYTGVAQNSHLFLEATLPAATTLTLRATAQAGSNGNYMVCQLKTNCNYNRSDAGGTSSSASTNNNMLTQG
tara:strand:- start:738 stop:1643 length:906 start_codon:yes stop_codon:yes gene_type:complete